MSSNSGSLSQFLVLNRTRYLEALKDNKGHQWTVVLGNEAGDLDTCASSIAYSYLSSELCGVRTIALLQTPRTDLLLRPENLYAYEIARMLPNQADLLCIDDIPTELLPCLSTSAFALVDHNFLSSRFSTSPFPALPTVVAILDHHDDEGAHKEADPRLIMRQAGSCASIVTHHFKHVWRSHGNSPPPELATLLLAAIFIDTNGLKAGGKGTIIDQEAATFLYRRSTLSSPSVLDSYRDNEGVALVIDTLDNRKRSVSHFSIRDLLRRDYKEYTYQSPSRITNVGLATVPQDPETWLQDHSSWTAVDGWMNERGLDALGVLFTYSRKGKHERQELWVVKSGNEDVKNILWEGLEASEELKLKRRYFRKDTSADALSTSDETESHLKEDFMTPAGGLVRLWQQGNHKATRKVVAPRVRELLESTKAS